MSVKIGPINVSKNDLKDLNIVDITFILIVLSIFVVVFLPILNLLYSSFLTTTPWESGGTFTLANYTQTYLAPSTYVLFGNTLFIAAGTAVVSTTIGVTMAWAVARTNTPFRWLLGLIMLLPYPIPAYMIAVSYIYMLGPNIGIINNMFLEPYFSTTVSIYSYWGIIGVMGLSKSTIAFLITLAVFRHMNPSFEDASRVSGAGTLMTFRRITLPLVTPSVSAAFLLIFITSLDAFGVPVFLGLPRDPPIHVFATKIWDATSNQTPPNYSLATALSTTLVILGILGLLLQRKATGLREKYTTVTGEGYSPERYDLGRWRWASFGLGIGVLLFAVVLPFGVLLLASFTSTWFGDVFFISDRVSFTLAHYKELFGKPIFISAVTNSLIIGLVGATLGMIFILIASYLVIKVDGDRSKLAEVGAPVLDQMLFLPAAIPGIVFGLGLFWMAITYPVGTLYGSIWLIMIGYIARELPVGSRTVYGSITQIHDELEEQSYMAGGGWFTTIRRVVLPLASKGFIAGWILLFIAMLRKISIPIFLATRESQVIPILIFRFKFSGEFEALAATGVFVVSIIIGTVILAHLLGYDLVGE